MGAQVTSKVSLSAENVCARRGDTPVLHGISLSALAGHWLSLVGPNGAGKSTLLRCLAGLGAIDQGQILLMGRPLREWALSKRAQCLSWLGQQQEGDEAMSVRQTVALGRLPYQGWLGLKGMTASDHHAINQALVDTDMQDKADHALQSLSGGERQRVNLARALAVQAPVLLLDEPVAHLDAPHQRLLAQVLKREASAGRCVISVLHELPLALQADRMAVMAQGRLLALGACDDPVVHRAVEAVFQQAIRVTQVDQTWTVLPRF